MNRDDGRLEIIVCADKDEAGFDYLIDDIEDFLIPGVNAWLSVVEIVFGMGRLRSLDDMFRDMFPSDDADWFAFVIRDYHELLLSS